MGEGRRASRAPMRRLQSRAGSSPARCARADTNSAKIPLSTRQRQDMDELAARSPAVPPHLATSNFIATSVERQTFNMRRAATGPLELLVGLTPRLGASDHRHFGEPSRVVHDSSALPKILSLAGAGRECPGSTRNRNVPKLLFLFLLF